MKKTVVLLLTFLFACSTENWESLRTKSEEALDEKNYSRAIEYLEEALSKEPQNAEAHYYLGQVYRLMFFADGSNINNENISYALKSAEHFRKTIEISPNYTGKKFVVDPYSKIQSIWGTIALNYLYRDNPDSAKLAFNRGQVEGGFYPAIMEYNRNIMASCQKNAILFTNGDNDTYPMWFLQFMQKYRTDITVVNLSLLNDPWYIKKLKNAYPSGENNLFMTLIDLKIDSLRPTHWKEQVVEISAKHDPLNKEGKIEWTVKPTFEDNAVRVQDIMLMEVLKSNDWNRPLYFSTTVYSVNKIGLDKYLSLEGLVYKLNSHEGKLSAEKMYSNLTKVYTYNGVRDEHIGYVDEIANLYQNYREAFITLASLYDEVGQKAKVKEVLDFMDEMLSETQLPYSSEELLNKSDSLYDKNL